MYTPTITKEDLMHCDLLFYRPKTIFGMAIGLFEAIVNGKFDRITFSHVAIMLYNGDVLRRFDAREGYKTDFRMKIGQAYMFRFDMITPEQQRNIQKYCLSRRGSKYDRKGILSFLWKRQREDEFSDYCSELIKNALVSAGKMEDCERISPFGLYKVLRHRMYFHGIIL